MEKQRVLITGIHGFTGRYMAVEMADAGYHVFGTGTSLSSESNYVQVTLSDKKALTKTVEYIQPDVVIHLAALAFVGHHNADDFYQVNLIGTRNLLEALAQSGTKLKAILLASSANVYGNGSAEALSEHTPPSPANDYGVSKLSMEYLAHLWMDKLPIIITRPFNYTGVGQSDRFLIPKIVEHFKRRASYIEVGNVDVWRDFSDVRSLIKAYSRLIKAKAFGQTINVCSGKVYSLRQILALCEQITGHTIETRVNPSFIRTHEVKAFYGNAQLLKDLIGGWESIPLEETLSWMLNAV